MPSLRTGRPRPGAGSAAMDQSARQSSPRTSRTAEVLYLLSRGAQLEHPHMINVHYAAHQPGPTLRDVKARLVALRGKGMPDAFSWSYKRKYKGTFIWCDLFDDDLIHPLPGSDEYVLKAVKLFDVNVAASQLDGEVALEHEELPLIPTRTSSPGTKPSSRHAASRLEHLHVENDVSLAIKKSLLLINAPQLTGVMGNLKGGGAPAVCSVEHSDVSSSRTFQDRTPAGSSGARTERSQTTTNSAASQTAPKKLHKDVTTDCNLGMSKKDKITSVSPPHLRSKTREKESSAIYAQEETADSGPDDPFLYGVLRKATKFGSSFRPRLCRGVDVIDATRTKSKLHCRSKARELLEEPTCEAESVDVPEPKSLQEFTSLAEAFDSKDLRATSNSPVIQVKSCVTPVESEAPPRRPFGSEALDASYRKTMEVLAKLPNSRGACRVHTHDHVPLRDQRSFRSESKGNKQLEVLKLEAHSKSPQNCKPSCDSHDEYLPHSCSIHGMPDDDDDDVPVQVEKERDSDLKQRSRGGVHKATMASFGASTVRCGNLLLSPVTRAKATVKTPEERRIKGPRNNMSKVEDATKPQRSEMNSRPTHNGNKQGLKSMAPATNGKLVECTTPAAAAEAATSENSHPNEGVKRWPFELPARPRDFKSREDRPLVPGLTDMDWEKSLQEACMHSDPPANLVLHECSQCGRTFKPESLQVHMRGCRGVNKLKPVSQRRVSL